MTPQTAKKARRQATIDPYEHAAGVIPTTWLDPLLSGVDSVIGKPPWGCQDIENLLEAIRGRIVRLSPRMKNKRGNKRKP